MAVDLDDKFIKLTISLARKGLGKVEPNPYVGCVIVKDGKIVASAYHERFGGPHAEPLAINKLLKRGRPDLLKCATLYVNLEPCCHTNKKTPPCVPVIIKSGIKKVVAGMLDPNPEVSGKGIRMLKAKGIKCKTGICEKECQELNKVYIKNITQKMPYTILKSAMTLDGKIATCNGDSKWITSEKSRDYVHKLRSGMDAVLVGVNTVLKDNPELTSHGKGKNPVRVVIDPDGKIGSPQFQLGEGKIKILDGTVPTIIFTEDAAKSKNRNVEFVRLKKVNNGSFDFKTIVQELYKRGIYRLLIEGGGETNWYALFDEVVDEVLFFIAPKIFGGRNSKTPVEGEGIKKISDAWKIKDIEVEKIGGDILLKGVVNYE